MKSIWVLLDETVRISQSLPVISSKIQAVARNDEILRCNIPRGWVTDIDFVLSLDEASERGVPYGGLYCDIISSKTIKEIMLPKVMPQFIQPPNDGERFFPSLESLVSIIE